jgi:hypothetical protein
MTPVPTLSVCSLTAVPGPRLATILEELRAVADEIIVAVDARVDPSRLGHHARVADRIVRFEFAPPIERARPWLYGLCSGEWVLETDADEVLSRSFLAGLPDLLQDRTYRQHFLPCHWLFPDATHWLDEPPWSFEGARLFRNDPATIWVPGISHTRIEHPRSRPPTRREGPITSSACLRTSLRDGRSFATTLALTTGTESRAPTATWRRSTSRSSWQACGRFGCLRRSVAVVLTEAGQNSPRRRG